MAMGSMDWMGDVHLVSTSRVRLMDECESRIYIWPSPSLDQNKRLGIGNFLTIFKLMELSTIDVSQDSEYLDDGYSQ